MPDAEATAQTIWDAALAMLSVEVGPATYETVFRPMRPLGIENGRLLLAVNNQFAKDWVEDRHLALISRALNGVSGQPLTPHILVAQRPDPRALPRPVAPPSVEEPIQEDAFPGTPLHAKYTFENFVEGNSNRFAYALALSVARATSPGVAANPLFIWGGVGVGKTHLMQAIGHHVRANDPGRSVVYVSGETFVNHVVVAIRDSKTAQFRAKYRNVDLWLVDDVQFIASRERTRSEEEFFHTFNTLHQIDKQIVMSSDQPPRGLRILDERLRSRFEAGAIVDIKRPDVVERIAILQKKAAVTDAKIPLEVFDYIANITWNIRVLEGALTSLLAHASISGERITLDFARLVLKEYTSGEAKHQVTVQKVLEAVGAHFGVQLEDLLSAKRRRDIVVPRQVAMYIARELTSKSLVEIGNAFGGRDHSTVLHACSKISDCVRDDAQMASTVADLTSRIQSTDQ